MCGGKFGGCHITNTKPYVCRYCETRSALEAKVSALEANVADNNKSLLNRINALEEFITANVGNETGNAVAVTRPASPTTPNISSNENSTSQDSPNTTTNTVSTPQQDTAFKAVKKGAKPAMKKILPVTTSNKFQILAENLDEPEETRLIGDSIIREQLQQGTH